MAEVERTKWPDIDPAYHSVVEVYGRELFTLVFNAGMGRQAAVHLTNMADGMSRSQNARSRSLAAELQHAASVLASAFNEASSELARTKGWTGKMLEECERAIEQAIQARVELVKAPKIVLH